MQHNIEVEAFELGERLRQRAKAMHKMGYSGGAAKIRLSVKTIVRLWLTPKDARKLQQETQRYLREERSLRYARVTYKHGFIRVDGLVNRHKKIPANMTKDPELAT